MTWPRRALSRRTSAQGWRSNTPRKRAKLKAMAVTTSSLAGGALRAPLKLAELPRNSSPTRIRNRCKITGRPRAVYRKFKLSRLALRELASSARCPAS